ncbi:MAG TPA: radical SAM protein [Candidatus Acidoferrum sp.]|nr:radical SAM protein [Candidatus Acidoferrum sp.]
MKVLFVEPPKHFWFVMGEYLPPPLGILELAAYVESKVRDVEIEVLDCQAGHLDWDGLQKHVESFSPDIVASSSLATCNAYTTVQTLATAKKVNPSILTIAGGQHFTATADESLRMYPEVDVVIRREGELTLAELVSAVKNSKSFAEIKGMSFQSNGRVFHNPDRPLIANLDELPLPAYHFVENNMRKYHFTMMTGPKTVYALVEGSRGCPHRCTFCSQWKHWQGTYRSKSPERIAAEFESLHKDFGAEFLWLTDDNFPLGPFAGRLCNEIVSRGLAQDITWFIQARCDDIVRHSDLLPKMHSAGNMWILTGAESGSEETLRKVKKGISADHSGDAIRLMKKSGIFAQTTFIIGHRDDTHKTLSDLREFVNKIDPDLAIFMLLTPFPGTDVYEEARRNGWIEDSNWANYDMVHAIMPTDTLSRMELQEELVDCYRAFYGSWGQRFRGIFSSNKLKRRTYRYMAGQSVLTQFKP